MRFLITIVSVFSLLACKQSAELKTGTWRGVLALQGQELPFTFDVEKKDGKYQAYLNNVSEKILLDEVSVDGDSVHFNLHIFDADLRAKIEGDKLTGTFYKRYAPNLSLPFSATYGDNYRFEPRRSELRSVSERSEGTPGPTATLDYTGKYQLDFVTKNDTYPSVGIFEQKGTDLTGTFLTPMGDYRYLEGAVINDTLKLSTFDGNHAFLFIASLSGDSLKGDYYTGKSGHETFSGIRKADAKMPDPESLTFLKEGYDKIEFSFPDVNKNMISPADERFKDKVLILQIFGTWCPNCMDETKFLSQWYRDNEGRGVEILGLAYERKPDFDYASGRVIRMKEKLNVPYDFVIAGVNDKDEAAKTLPMLNKVIAFPTTIFIGRDGKVKRIYTGFEGPGTGEYHVRFKEHFNQLVNELLAEKMTSNVEVRSQKSLTTDH